ncbi:SseB family protein [Micromonospora sp. LZ34]
MTGWEPATEAEAALRDALRASDQQRYFRILARTDLLLPVPAPAQAGQASGWGTWTTAGRTHVLAFTSAAAMRACLGEHAGASRLTSYADLAGGWPNHEWWLAVNPGLPIEGYLPAWYVSQLSRGDVRLPGRTMGARARLERAETVARVRAAGPENPGSGAPPPAARPPAPGNGAPLHPEAPTVPLPPRVAAPAGPVGAAPDRRSVESLRPSLPPPYPADPARRDADDPGRADDAAPSAFPPSGADDPAARSRPGVPPPGPVSEPGRPAPPANGRPTGDAPARPRPRSFFEPASGRGSAYRDDPVRPTDRTLPPSRFARGSQPFPRRRPAGEPVPEGPTVALPTTPPQTPPGPPRGGGSAQWPPPPEEVTRAIPVPTERAYPGPPPDEETTQALPRRRPAPAPADPVDDLPLVAEPVSGPPLSRRGFTPIVIEGTIVESRDLDEPPDAGAPVSGPTGPDSAGAPLPGSPDARPAGPPAAERAVPPAWSAETPAAGSTRTPAWSAEAADAEPAGPPAWSAETPAAGSATTPAWSAEAADAGLAGPPAWSAEAADAEPAGPPAWSANGAEAGGGSQPRPMAEPSEPAGGTGPEWAGGDQPRPAVSSASTDQQAAGWVPAQPASTDQRAAGWLPSPSASTDQQAAGGVPAQPASTAQRVAGWLPTRSESTEQQAGPTSSADQPESGWIPAQPAAADRSGAAWLASPEAAGAPRAGTAPEAPGAGPAQAAAPAAENAPDLADTGPLWTVPGSEAGPHTGGTRAAAPQPAGPDAGAHSARPDVGRPGEPATAPAAGPARAEFEPANAVEEDLLDAAGAGSTDTFLSTLLLARVLLPVSPESVPGSRPGEPGFVWRTEELDGETFVVVYTSPERLADHTDASVETVRVRFVQLIRRWPDEAWSFAVNPGTPVGAKLPGEQIVGLANWAAEVGLGDDESEPEAPQAPPPAERTRYTPPAADPARPVVMQKAVAPSQLAYYLERGYDRVSGFVHRAGELAHLTTPAQLFEALGLGYPDSPFAREADEIYVLRWPAHRPSLYRIPYGGQNEAAMRAMEGWVIERPPFRGNGFAPGESSDVVAEFKVDSARLPHGAQLWRIGADGTERMVAVLDTDALLWRQVGAP